MFYKENRLNISDYFQKEYNYKLYINVKFIIIIEINQMIKNKYLL